MSAETVIEASKVSFSPLLIPTISVFLILYAIHLWQTNNRAYKLALKLPGPTPLPFVGNAHLLMPFGKQRKITLLINFHI